MRNWEAAEKLRQSYVQCSKRASIPIVGGIMRKVNTGKATKYNTFSLFLAPQETMKIAGNVTIRCGAALAYCGEPFAQCLRRQLPHCQRRQLAFTVDKIGGRQTLDKVALA